MRLSQGPSGYFSGSHCSARVWRWLGLVGCTVMRDPSHQSRYSVLIFQEARGQQKLGDYSPKGPPHPKVANITSQAQ